VAPKQQALLQSDRIDLLTLSQVEKVSGRAGRFKVQVRKRARYVDLTACIGCGMCYEPCPVSIDNEFEEGMSERKAIYVPCAGALPNAPCIDMGHCLRAKGEDCKLCKEACMFDAIQLDQRDEVMELDVQSVVVATGYELIDLSKLERYGHGKAAGVVSAFEFERLYASNGPTEGKVQLRDGRGPTSVAIIHCVGREERGYCSAVCCMYSLKFARYVHHKLPDAKVHQLYVDMCVPGKSYQRFLEGVREEGVGLVRASDVRVDGPKQGIKQGTKDIVRVGFTDGGGSRQELEVDMVVLAPAIVPRADAAKLADLLDVDLDRHGFFVTDGTEGGLVTTTREGVYVAGCARGPTGITETVCQADAVVGWILSGPSEVA
jgi:heterodisulfide reductase subunit A